MPGFEFFGEEERKEVNDVLETGILMRYGFDGPRKGVWKAKELERALCERLGCAYAQLTSSGTTALTTALAALGIGAGDEVIMPSFTFVASAESVLSVGAVPVIADVDETLTLKPASRPGGDHPGQNASCPCTCAAVWRTSTNYKPFARNMELLLLEDACQSTGATYKGQALGTIGDAGTLSFDFVKTITCGEGGAILTNYQRTYEKCDQFTDHGHDHKGVDRGADPNTPSWAITSGSPSFTRQSRPGADPKVGPVSWRCSEPTNKPSRTAYRSSRRSPGAKHRILKATAATYLRLVPAHRRPSPGAQSSMSSESERHILAGNFYWYINQLALYPQMAPHQRGSMSLNPP